MSNSFQGVTNSNTEEIIWSIDEELNITQLHCSCSLCMKQTYEVALGQSGDKRMHFGTDWE